MTKYHEISEDGVVVNSAIFDDESATLEFAGKNWVKGEGVSIGWGFKKGKFIAPSEPETEPEPPSFRSLPNDVFHAMRDTLGITDEQVETAIAAMTEEGIERNLALRRFHSAVHYERDSELLNGLAVALGVSQSDLDTAWRQAEELL